MPPTSLELGDTKRRLVDVVAEGFCRFSRYFTERLDVVADGSPIALHAEGVVPATVVLSRPDGSERFRRDRDFTVERDGTLTVVDATTIPPGTALPAEFVPLPVSRRSTEVDGAAATFTFDVPSSAAPDLPAVASALPAFARRVTQSEERVVVVHDGRVVRVHLDRPWYSSGSGELLGVAVDVAGSLAPLLTRWARDPLTRGPGPTDGPTTAAFPRAASVAVAVDGRFDVAGHDVTFDPDRRLWMADVVVDARFGYRPFVQLHVCRYQPLAVDGQHLSGTVELPAMRLGALRHVVVSNRAGDDVHVRLTGPDDVNVVIVIAQQADGTTADPDLQWQDISSTTLTRSGSRSSAVHQGVVPVPPTGAARRLVIEDAEPVRIDVAGAQEDGAVVAYREVIAVPPTW